MQELPDEVTLFVLEQVPIEDLPAFCASNKQYRALCSDSYFWHRVFEREGLVILEEGIDLPSWMAIYQNSLLSEQRAEYILSLYERTRRARLSLFNPIPLYQIRHVELLGEKDATLSSLITRELYYKQLRDVQNKSLPMFNPNSKNIPPEKYLSLSKRGEDFILSVYDEADESFLEQVVSKERSKDILYRLAYYGLLQMHESIFSVYARESSGQDGNRRMRSRRVRPLQSE